MNREERRAYVTERLHAEFTQSGGWNAEKLVADLVDRWETDAAHVEATTRENTGIATLRGILERAQDRNEGKEPDELHLAYEVELARLQAENDWLFATRANVMCPQANHAKCGDTCCRSCGAKNVVWYTGSVLWNRVVGGHKVVSDPGGILCPRCFILRAEKAGIGVGAAWQLLPGDQVMHSMCAESCGPSCDAPITRDAYDTPVDLYQLLDTTVDPDDLVGRRVTVTLDDGEVVRPTDPITLKLADVNAADAALRHCADCPRLPATVMLRMNATAHRESIVAARRAAAAETHSLRPRGTPPLMFRLWSGKYSQWWKPNELGYTADIHEAGLYTEEDALRLVRRSAMCGIIEQVTSMVVAVPKPTKLADDTTFATTHVPRISIQTCDAVGYAPDDSRLVCDQGAGHYPETDHCAGAMDNLYWRDGEVARV